MADGETHHSDTHTQTLISSDSSTAASIFDPLPICSSPQSKTLLSPFTAPYSLPSTNATLLLQIYSERQMNRAQSLP